MPTQIDRIFTALSTRQARSPAVTCFMKGNGAPSRGQRPDALALWEMVGVRCGASTPTVRSSKLCVNTPDQPGAAMHFDPSATVAEIRSSLDAAATAAWGP